MVTHSVSTTFSAVKTSVTIQSWVVKLPMAQSEHSGLPFSAQEEASFKDKLNLKAYSNPNGGLDYFKCSSKERGYLGDE